MNAFLKMSTVSFWDTQISNKSFTYGWVYDQLLEKDPEFQAFIKEKEIIEASGYDVSNSKGCFSEVFKITFVATDGSKYNTILKLPGSESFDSAIQSAFCVDDSGIKYKSTNEMEKSIIEMHNRECDYYNKFAHEGIPIPVVFNAVYWDPTKGQDGGLLMKDLSSDSKMMNFSESLSLAQIFHVVDAVAKLQAYSIRNQAFVDSCDYKFPLRNVDLSAIVETLVPALKQKHLSVIGAELDTFLPIALSPQFQALGKSKNGPNENVPRTLIHGDIYTNNLFFKIDSNKNVTSELKCIMDWQHMHVNTPGSDLARFLILSCDGDIRRRNKDVIFQHFYSNLIKELNGIEVPFTLDAFESSYAYSFVEQTFQMILMVSIFTSFPISKNEEHAHNAGTEKLILRIKHALEDANKYIEKMKWEL